jgi:copper chaperone
MHEFTVNDMTCGHCVSVITKAVHALDAQARVEADLPQHRVRIDGKPGMQELSTAIREAGFTPVPVA